MLYCVDVSDVIFKQLSIEIKIIGTCLALGHNPTIQDLCLVRCCFFIFVHTYTYICMYIENVRHTNNKTYLKKFCSKISQQKSTRLYISFWMKRVFCATSAKILVALMFACNHQIKYTLQIIFMQMIYTYTRICMHTSFSPTTNAFRPTISC